MLTPAISSCLSLLVLLVSSALAGESEAEWGSGHFTFHLDNDLFAGVDENYTNGARLSWISSERDGEDIAPVQRFISKLNGDADSLRLAQKIWGFENLSEVSYQYGFALTQLMFTPKESEPSTAPQGQRPYAGWAGLGFSVHAKDENAMHSVELVIGILGPHAYAEEAQDVIHDFWGIDKFNGWDSQIPEEPTVNLYFTQRRRLELLERGSATGISVDGLSEAGMALGTFKVDAWAGLLVRAGWNLPYDFSDPRLSETANTQRMFVKERADIDAWSVYLIAGGRGRVVGHDATLDGPVFRDFNTGVDKEWWVLEGYAGFGVRRGNCEFSYVHTYRTEEFEQQDGGASFGSVAIRVSY